MKLDVEERIGNEQVKHEEVRSLSWKDWTRKEKIGLAILVGSMLGLLALIGFIVAGL